jgi:hypothetical protein
LEEVGVIGLHGANLECDAQKELLLGVSPPVDISDVFVLSFHIETILFYTLYYCKLARTRRTLIQRVTVMDFKA